MLLPAISNTKTNRKKSVGEITRKKAELRPACINACAPLTVATSFDTIKHYPG